MTQVSSYAKVEKFINIQPIDHIVIVNIAIWLSIEATNH